MSNTTKKRPIGKFVAYYHGKNIDNQEKALKSTFWGGMYTIVASYHETNAKRRYYKPELYRALARCTKESAGLVIPIMGNLAYNTKFLEMMLETKVKVFACDLKGTQEVDMHLLAMVSNEMRKDIGRATKRKLADLKRQGVKLGAPDWKPGNKEGVKKIKAQADEFAIRVRDIIKDLRGLGFNTYSQLAERLNARGIKTMRGGRWHATTVRNIELRLGDLYE